MSPQRSPHISIIVNGEQKILAAGSVVADLISSLGLVHTTVAVEQNKQIVPRALHATTPLKADDRLEIVTLVGGG